MLARPQVSEEITGFCSSPKGRKGAIITIYNPIQVAVRFSIFKALMLYPEDTQIRLAGCIKETRINRRLAGRGISPKKGL